MWLVDVLLVKSHWFILIIDTKLQKEVSYFSQGFEYLDCSGHMVLDLVFCGALFSFLQIFQLRVGN